MFSICYLSFHGRLYLLTSYLATSLPLMHRLPVSSIPAPISFFHLPTVKSSFQLAPFLLCIMTLWVICRWAILYTVILFFFGVSTSSPTECIEMHPVITQLCLPEPLEAFCHSEKSLTFILGTPFALLLGWSPLSLDPLISWKVYLVISVNNIL